MVVLRAEGRTAGFAMHFVWRSLSRAFSIWRSAAWHVGLYYDAGCV